MDTAEDAIAYAKLRYEKRGVLEFKVGNVERIPLDDDSVDMLLCLFLQEASRRFGGHDCSACEGLDAIEICASTRVAGRGDAKARCEFWTTPVAAVTRERAGMDAALRLWFWHEACGRTPEQSERR